MVRLSGGYEERAEAVLARPGQAGSQVSTSQDPLGGECSVRLAKLEQTRVGSMSECDGCCSLCARHAGSIHRPSTSAKAAGAAASSATAPALIGCRACLLEGTPVDPSFFRHAQPDSAITVAVTDSAPVLHDAPAVPSPRCSARRFAAAQGARTVNAACALPQAGAAGAVGAVGAYMAAQPENVHSRERADSNEHANVGVDTVCIAALLRGAVAPQPACSALGLLSTSAIRTHSTTRSHPGSYSGSTGRIRPWHRFVPGGAVSP